MNTDKKYGLGQIILTTCYLLLAISYSFAQGKDIFTLEELIKLALENNPRLKAAKNLWQAKRAEISQARALDDPWLGLEYENIPRGSKDLEKSTMEMYSIQQMIPFPSKLFTKARIAAREANAQEQIYKEKEREIIQEVKSAFQELFFIQKSIQINKENKFLLEQFAKISERKYSVGRAMQQDVLKAQVELSKLANELITLEQRKQTAVAKMNVLINRDPREGLEISVEEKPLGIKYNLDELYHFCLENRPELKAYRLWLEKAKSSLSLAKQEYLPDFMVRYERREENDRFNSWDAMLGISVPLWFWEKENNQVRQMKAELEMAKYEYKQMENMVLFEVKDAYVKLDSARRLVELYKTTFIPQAEQTLKSSRIAYEADKIDFLNLLDSQRMLLDFKLDYYRTLADYEIALADLERAVGIELAK
ncbi:MAG: TolC family protein [Candidatus Omnitrophica bacterium]|nr:TolC family protein [Candidatus Omnitrophota bacterium]